jgi:erythromycin esterase-like protein
MKGEDRSLIESIRAAAVPLTGAPGSYDPLLALVGDAQFVLLGEASHGTHEFYRTRAEITRRLIEEKGFTAIAVEADWPDAHRVDSYICALSGDADPAGALADFTRFPTWMWRNADMRDFVGWLRAHNDSVTDESAMVRFYGLDLYSLHGSIEAVLNYLRTVDPEAAQRARKRYSCFDHFAEDTQAYGYTATIDMSRSCEDEVVGQLLELQRRAAEFYQSEGIVADEKLFHAEQNARLVRNAERYYRAMFGGRAASWNLRDLHMADTLDALVAHLGTRRSEPKVVVWAHNSHLGDARATDMTSRGEINLGQIVRERHPGRAVIVGFSTYDGTVTAAPDWDEPAVRMRVRPAVEGSYEALMHETGLDAFMLDLRGDTDVARGLASRRPERAIGVIYLPETEWLSHYLRASLVEQFDALLHIDTTQAVEPLEPEPTWKHDESHDAPETYPSGI